jgi:hypothetical protein
VSARIECRVVESVGGRQENIAMEIFATLVVLRGTVCSSIDAESKDDAIDVAIAREDAGDFKAGEVMDWGGRRLDEAALRDEINRRRASRR